MFETWGFYDGVDCVSRNPRDVDPSEAGGGSWVVVEKSPGLGKRETWGTRI